DAWDSLLRVFLNRAVDFAYGLFDFVVGKGLLAYAAHTEAFHLRGDAIVRHGLGGNAAQRLLVFVVVVPHESDGAQIVAAAAGLLFREIHELRHSLHDVHSGQRTREDIVV